MKKKIIHFLNWMNRKAADEPMALETDVDDIAMMYLAEYTPKLVDIERLSESYSNDLKWLKEDGLLPIGKSDIKYAFIAGYNAGKLENEDVFPIMLTEKWLVKFFPIVSHKDCGNEFSKKGVDYSITNFYNEGFRFWIADCADCPHYKKVEYVHQLQNLYFALTGNELEVTQ